MPICTLIQSPCRICEPQLKILSPVMFLKYTMNFMALLLIYVLFSLLFEETDGRMRKNKFNHPW